MYAVPPTNLPLPRHRRAKRSLLDSAALVLRRRGSTLAVTRRKARRWSGRQSPEECTNASVDSRMEHAGCFNLETEKEMDDPTQMGVTTFSSSFYGSFTKSTTHTSTKQFTG